MREHLSRLVVTLFVLAFALLLTSPALAAVESRNLQFSGFSEVSVGGGMQLQVTQGQKYSIQVEGETSDLDQLKVEKSGKSLDFSMNWSFTWRHRGKIRINIVMPALNGVDLSGGSQGTIAMNLGSDRFAADLSGGAGLHGELNCGDLEVSVSGGSEAGLTGSAASLTLDSSGGAEVDFRDLAAQNAKVSMSGGSEARLNINGTLSGDLSGGSQITYYGNATLGDTEFSGGSKIRKGQ